jgi:hypothetical protein
MGKKSSIDDLLERKTKRHLNWFDRLSDSDKSLALEARKRIHEQGLEVLPLAKNFVTRFQLTVSPYTVATWIRSHDK